MANIVIDIASEFTGAKAFKQAETSTQKLTNGVKKLAGALGVAYGTTAILAYSKRAVKAAAADEKAQKQLALALNNVGLGRDAASSEAYIQRLQREFGIVDDLLRPAYQTLAIATQDTLESQRLLNLALDISAATGKDLGSVTAALSKAYLGNNTSLTRLGVGISKADLKTKSFLEVTDQLAQTFKGAATESANSLSGSMAKLEVATANVSEILGKGIIDSLMVLGNDTSVSELAIDMETAATNAAKLLVTISKVIKAINTPLEIVSGSLAAFVEKTSPLVNLIVEGDPSGFMKSKPKPFSTGMSVSGQSQTKAVSSSQTQVQKETLKINKESLKLAKARATFDLQKIQIEAALKGKISAEDEIRLKLMKAIEEENLTNIEKYQKALTVAQEKTKELNTLLTTIKLMEIKDPFGLWKIDPITASINELTKSMFAVQTQIQANGKEFSSFANLVATTVIQPNLKEFSSSFSGASAEAAAAAAAANASLSATTAAAIKAAADAAAASAAAIAAANKATGDAIAANAAGATSALAKLNADTAASTEAAAKAAQDAIDAANKTAAETVASILAKASADAAAKAAAALAANNSILEAFKAAEAADRAAGAAITGSKVEITVNAGVGDPNAIAEAIAVVIRDATARGTLESLGIE